MVGFGHEKGKDIFGPLLTRPLFLDAPFPLARQSILCNLFLSRSAHEMIFRDVHLDLIYKIEISPNVLGPNVTKKKTQKFPEMFEDFHVLS